MDTFRQWMLCVIIAAGVGTLVCIVSPKGTIDKTVRIVVGIFIVSTICMSATDIDFEDAFLPVISGKYEGERKSDEIDNYLISVCENTIETEVLRTAEKYGITVKSIGTDACIDDDNCIIINSISIKIHNADSAKRFGFADTVEKNLGAYVEVIAE